MISENRSQTPINNPQIEQVQKRLDAWRKTRKRRSRIPERLWESAARVAGQYGLHKTARALRLDYNALKKRLKAVTDGNESVPAFVELISPVSSPNSECLIELESRHGEKMRIHLKGVALPDVATMGAMFWRNER
jgi:hypothetical protein